MKSFRFSTLLDPTKVVLFCFDLFHRFCNKTNLNLDEGPVFYINRYFIHSFLFCFSHDIFYKFFLYLVCVTVCQNFPFYWIISKLRKSTLGKTKEMVRFIFFFLRFRYANLSLRLWCHILHFLQNFKLFLRFMFLLFRSLFLYWCPLDVTKIFKILV